MKKRLFVCFLALCIVTICTVLAYSTGANPTLMDVIGSYGSVIVLTILLYKFPFSFFLWFLFFDILATALGSVLNFYTTIDQYDWIVHFISGILLAEAGRIIIAAIGKKRKIENFVGISIFVGVLFSFSCAGLWEIYEFAVGQLGHKDMQGNNLNTMGDIVSGFFGGLSYAIVYTTIIFRKVKNFVSE